MVASIAASLSCNRYLACWMIKVGKNSLKLLIEDYYNLHETYRIDVVFISDATVVGTAQRCDSFIPSDLISDGQVLNHRWQSSGAGRFRTLAQMAQI